MVELATLEDFDAWCALAREVEYLFGPMADEKLFRDALVVALQAGAACCIRECSAGPGGPLAGGIIVDVSGNRIEWLAVSRQCRGNGYGRLLLDAALSMLDPVQPVIVQTFAPSCSQGMSARQLYLSAGFRDDAEGEPTPADIPTIVMIRFPEGETR